MAVYIYDPETGRMVDKKTREPMVAEYGPVTTPLTNGDIEGYESPITGEWIGSRRQERDHMREHGVHHAADAGKPRKFKNRRFVEKHGLWDRAEV